MTLKEKSNKKAYSRTERNEGVTVLQYYAAKAMQGMVSFESGYSIRDIVDSSFVIATAMLKAEEEALKSLEN